MFYVKTKPQQEVLEAINAFDTCKKLLYIICSGCNEVNFSLDEATKFFKNCENIYDIKTKILDYICNQDFVVKYINCLKDEIEEADVVVIFSCGVGVSTVANILKQKIVLTISNTFCLNGYKGYNVPYEGKFGCILCGSCYLNHTAGICPIANCSKSLLNGPCGGAKDGKCEVDKTKDCVWEKIFFKLEKFNKLKIFHNKILIHSYKTTL